MARKRFIIRDGNHVGEFPPEDGWQPGRRGIRRTLCSVASLLHLTEDEQQLKLWDLYRKAMLELQQTREKDKEQRANKKRETRDWTVKQAVTAWLADLAGDCTDKTLNAYRKSASYYLEACGNHRVRDYDSSHHAMFLKHLKTVESNRKIPGMNQFQTIAANTQNYHARQFSIFLRWCYFEKRILEHRPKPRLPRKTQTDMETYSMADLETLRLHILKRLEDAEARDHARDICNMKNMLRAFMLATQSIMRLGAIWALMLENIDAERRIIRIRDNPELGWVNKKNKWPNKSINNVLMEFLEQDLADRNEKERFYLDKGNGTPWRFDTSDISSLAGKLCKECGLPKLKPFHWGMRATMITSMLNDGVDPFAVQQLADHDNISTTMLYMNSRTVQQKNATDALARISKSVTEVSRDRP
ncbi:hypothetical protein GCM10023116_13370 [Kistimonas scapharcae]|uniref:Tyr recombinase domain-containing protein n=1 Tax=Kistimonas scapharcae TaxID=1036133 RepID=A0ABP8UYQ6_9GAMM